MSDETISVLVVDDHPVVRDGLIGMISSDPGLVVVGEAGNGDEAVTACETLRPDVVLLDLRMPGSGGVDAIRTLRGRGDDTRILVLTTYDGDRDVSQALESGATGYLLKDATRGELLAGIRATARGETTLAPSVTSKLVGRLRGPANGSLSERELEVLRLVADGRTNRAIADTLFVSEATVKSHLLNIYAKLEVTDRAAAVSQGYRRGLLG
ncbi:response regulator transcription factor [Planctomonas sp. JC2975]|uniref:response regulator n=1 Tax=Planctomonas sp. JC2975 TaxID=2729626 RepID=UPI00147432DE|nr:response regulator transcription factor [Planctomonas sp. JC2975]NNC10626.1 response regulator transcription factor [Planctomonas sp. JC2975]